jgi:hypothetical protein
MARVGDLSLGPPRSDDVRIGVRIGDRSDGHKQATCLSMVGP